MRRLSRLHRYWILINVVFVLGMIHRFWGLSTYPAQHDTHDEYHYLWVGMSLLAGNPPMSWSHLNAVPSDAVGTTLWNGHYFPAIRPAFDHPPLYSLLCGAIGWLAPHEKVKGEATGAHIWAVDVLFLRLLSLTLYATSFWLLFALCRRVASPSIAALSCAFYSFLEPIVAHSRLAVADNLIVALLLLLFFVLESPVRSLKRRKALAAVTVAAMVLSKLVAASAIPAIATWEAVRSKRQTSAMTRAGITGLACAVFLLLIYFKIYGWASAKATLHIQSGRFYDFGGLFDLVRRQPIVHTEGNNLWLMAGWLVLGIDLVKGSRKLRALYAGFIGFLFGYVFFVPADYYGWYAIPFFPMLSIVLASALRGAHRNPTDIVSVFIIVIVACAALTPLAEMYESARPVLRYFYALFVVVIIWPSRSFSAVRLKIIRASLIVFVGFGLIHQAVNQKALDLSIKIDAKPKDRYGTFVTKTP